jgi:tRNA pseudouridine55 synthase
MATGVLVVGVGKATRLLGYLASTTKCYDATLRLGQSTSTDDAEGEVLARTPADGVSAQAISAAAKAYVGDFLQVPSQVSAIKVGGERSYRRARRGEQVDLPARPVRIHSLDVAAVHRVGPCVDVDVSLTCSSGTYVRALARDIGADLGVGGHLTRLRRTAVGAYDLTQAHTLDALEADLAVVSLADVAAANFATYAVSEEQAAMIGHGRQLVEVNLGANGPVAIFGPTGDFLALYEQRSSDARALAVFAG